MARTLQEHDNSQGLGRERVEEALAKLRLRYAEMLRRLAE